MAALDYGDWRFLGASPCCFPRGVGPKVSEDAGWNTTSAVVRVLEKGGLSLNMSGSDRLRGTRVWISPHLRTHTCMSNLHPNLNHLLTPRNRASWSGA